MQGVFSFWGTQCTLRGMPNANQPSATADTAQLFEMAVSWLQRQEPVKAIPLLEQYTQRAPGDAAALSNLAFAYNETEQFEKAIPCGRRALDLDPQSLSAKTNLGLALRESGEPVGLAEASRLLEEVYRLQPTSGEALFNFCLARFDQGDFDGALQGFTACRQQFGDFPKILENIAACQIKLQNYPTAITVLSSLLAQPGLTFVQRAKGFHDLGIVAIEQGNAKTALDHFKKALELKPAFCEALVHQGIAQNTLGQYDLALKSFSAAFTINPEFQFLLGRLAHQKMLCADWDDLDSLIETLNAAVLAGKAASEPFGYQAIAEDPKLLMICAKTYSERQFPKAPIKTDYLPESNALVPRNSPSASATSSVTPSTTSRAQLQSDRITLGFLSGEFRDHATSMLIVGLLEVVNRQKFQVILFDNGWKDDSSIRKRLEASCEIVPIRALNDAQALTAIKQRQVDVLFNLNGFFGEMRHNLFVERAAPLQVNYLGFPGTLGIANIDYIIADEIVAPKAHEPFYLERVLRMPANYQCTDNKRDRPVLSKTKADLGLKLIADDSFVFCCFNNTYKITPTIFSAWMKILNQVPKSVLWLLETHAIAKENLRARAAALGADPNRLVFAPRVTPQEHLARHAAADLVLDTTPYNAHTTASDALWMGIPMLTVQGTTFPGRVGESLLRALDVGEELIAHDLEDYVAKAVNIAHAPQTIADLKARLAGRRLTSALFDTERYTKNFEALIESVCKTHST